MDILKTNSFKVVGRLASADLKENFKQNGDAYISGKAVVISNIGGRDNEFEISFYTNKLTKDKKESQLFVSYSKMGELIGKKVEVTGDIRESRFFSRNNSQMVSSQQLSGRFVRGTTETAEDCATFEIAGFVIEEVKEKVNKNNEVYRYDLAIGQANYSNTSMQRFVLHINPNDREIVNGVKGYHVGQTVQVNGDLNFFVETQTVEANREGGFGESVTRTYTNKFHNFFIKGGSAPIASAEMGAYGNDMIRTLVSAYKARDVELSEKAKADGTSAPAEKDSAVFSRQTSLL